jgi:hypothetical protein
MTTTYYKLSRYHDENGNGLPEGDDVSMSHLEAASHKDGTLVSDSMLVASDYSGNDGGIVRVNVNWWGENFSDQRGTMWWSTHGGHGTFGVVVDARVLDESYEWDDEDTAYAAEQMREALESLENYPILDEEAHSELEMQQQNEQFHESQLDARFAVKLAEALDRDNVEEDATEMHQETLQMFYHMIGGDVFSIYPHTEGSGDNLAIVFHFDDFIKKLRDALAALTTMLPYASEQTKTLIAEALFSSSPPPYQTFEYRGQIVTALRMGQEFARLNAERKAVVLDFLEEQGDQWVVEHIASGDVFEKLGKAGFSEFSR